MFGDKRMKIIGHQCHFQNQKEIKRMFRILIQHNSDKNVPNLITNISPESMVKNSDNTCSIESKG